MFYPCRNLRVWHVNYVRELQNVVERAVILCGENGMLEPEHLGLSGDLLGATSATVATALASSADKEVPSRNHRRNTASILMMPEGDATDE